MNEMSVDCTHIFKKKTVQFFFAVGHAHPITRVYNPDDGIRLLKIIAPVWPESALTTNIPLEKRNSQVSDVSA